MGIKIKLRGSAAPREVKSKVHLTSAYRPLLILKKNSLRSLRPLWLKKSLWFFPEMATARS